MKLHPRYGYLLQQNKEGHYASLHITIKVKGAFYGRAADAELRFKWQTDDEQRENSKGVKEWPSWYGLHTYVQCERPEEAKPLTALAVKIQTLIEERVAPDTQDSWKLRELVPTNVIWALECCGILRMVYDARLSEYVLLKEIKAPEFRRWSNKLDSVLACDEAEARRLLTIETAKHHQHRLKEWLDSGAQVHIPSQSEPPTIEPSEYLLTSVFEREAQERGAQVTAG